MCSDDLKCAMIKAVCAVIRKVVQKFGWINRNFCVKEGLSFRNFA